MTATPAEIGALVVLVQCIRPAWDTRAIRPVLEGLAHHDLADLAYAAIRTAQDPAMRRPAAIAFDSGHWQRTVREIETLAERDTRIQGQLDAATERERDWAATTYRERAARAHANAEAVRQQIRPTTRHETPNATRHAE